MKCIVLVVLCLAYAEAGAIPSGSRDPSSEQAGGKCEPGTIAAVDCNTCVCTEIGTLVCTEKNCNTPEAKIPVPMNALFDSVRQNRNLVTKTNAGANTEELKRQYSKENLEYLDNSEENSKKTIYEEENSNQDKPEHSFEELDNAHVELKYSLDDIHSIEEHNNVLEETDRIKDKHNVLKRSVCKLNQVFQMECNTCKCAPDGQSFTCTQNECMEGDKNKEVEVFMEGEGVDHSERHSVCKPLSTFYIGCNTCHCNQYGTDYSCTNKPCPLPEDVELFHELKDMKPIIPYTNDKVVNSNTTQKAEANFKI